MMKHIYIDQKWLSNPIKTTIFNLSPVKGSPDHRHFHNTFPALAFSHHERNFFFSNNTKKLKIFFLALPLLATVGKETFNQPISLAYT